MDFQKFIDFIGKNLDYFNVDEIKHIVNGEYASLLKSLNKKYKNETDKKRRKKLEEIVYFLDKFIQDYKDNAYKYNYQAVETLEHFLYWFDFYIKNNFISQAEEVYKDIEKNFPDNTYKLKKLSKKIENAQKKYKKFHKEAEESEKKLNWQKKIERLIGNGDYGEATHESLDYLQNYPNDKVVNDYLSKIDKLKSSNIINEVNEHEDYFKKADLLDLPQKANLKKDDLKEVYGKLLALYKKGEYEAGLKLINYIKEKFGKEDSKIQKLYKKFIDKRSKLKEKEQYDEYKLELNSLKLLVKNKHYQDAIGKANSILKKYPLLNKNSVFNLIKKINRNRTDALKRKGPTVEDKFQNFLMRVSSLNKKSLYTFYEKMAWFLRAKMDLKTSLQVVYHQSKSAGLKSFISDVINGLDSGIKISETLNWYKRIPKLDVSLIKIGENTGKLGEMFQSIYQYHKEAEERRKKIKSVMIYPSIIVGITLIIFGLLLVFLIPKFVGFYKQVGVDLPMITQKVIDISNFLRSDWHIVIISLILFFIFVKLFNNTTLGRYFFGYFTLRIPVLKQIIYRKYIIHFASNLSLLLKSGINLLQAIDLIIYGTDNPWYKDEFERLRFELETGLSFSKAVGLGNVENVGEYNNYYIPVDVAYALDIGEKTGQLGDMLEEVGERYDEDLKYIIKNLQSLIEPFVILLVGVVIFFFVLAIFLPLINMYDVIGEMGGL